MTPTKDMKIKDLIVEHNDLVHELGVDIKLLNTWKSKQNILAGRVSDLRCELEARSWVKRPAIEAEVSTIREVSLDLLCGVDHYENRETGETCSGTHPDARTVGIPYNSIIDLIKERFPDCQTSVACLRWYSVKVRAEEFGYEDRRLPQRRPRAKQKG